jgi:hypothetical protein
LRLEVDGTVLTEPDRPVWVLATAGYACPGPGHGSATADGGEVTVQATAEADDRLPRADGTVDVMVGQPPPAGGSLHVRGQRLTVLGRDFTYAADGRLTGPVSSRTWTVLPAAWRLTIPTAGP